MGELAEKMIAPKYRGITQDQIPSVEKAGATIKVIAGRIDGVNGPIRDLAVKIEYFDVTLDAETTFEYPTKRDDKVFAYVVEGSDYADDVFVESHQRALFGETGDGLKVKTKEGFRFLLVTGNPQTNQ